MRGAIDIEKMLAEVGSKKRNIHNDKKCAQYVVVFLNYLEEKR